MASMLDVGTLRSAITLAAEAPAVSCREALIFTPTPIARCVALPGRSLADGSYLLLCQSGIWAKSGGGIKDYAEFNWYPGGGTFGTGLPFDKWTCSLSMVGGKYAGGGEQIQVYRDGGSGTWIVAGSSSSDNSGAFARISCTQFG